MPSHDLIAQARLDSPLGPLTAAVTARGLAGLWFDGQVHHPGVLGVPERPDHPLLQRVAAVMDAYFDGRMPAADALPFDLQGTPFQQAVWRALLEVPAGRTSTYGRVAERIGRPTAVRAVGAAVGRNPVSVLVPCHRILGRDGTLTGYDGGLDRKRALLDLEGVAYR